PSPMHEKASVYRGKVMSGPEYVTVLDGMTGETITRADWPSREGFASYNRYSRNQMCPAYLDGETPHLIVERGTYGTIKVDAWAMRDGELHRVWRWDNRNEPDRYRGQGAHSMHAVDVDEDGRDEVFLGSAVLDDDGESLWSTGLGHPDHHYVSDIMPDRPGLEVYYGIEPDQEKNAMCVTDARTGEILWGLDKRTWHVHSSGLCSDILAEHKGLECYAIDRDKPDGRVPRMFTADGELISQRDMGFRPRAAHWDADLHRELLLDGRFQEFDGTMRSKPLKGEYIASADVLGDWREEIIMTVPGELRIYTTTIPADDRRTCLMQDPIYRLDVAIAAMGYTQVPMKSTCFAAE
ncbi:MAG: silent information regulator protein Sir2, partial [Planctomycetota bacterium]